MPSLRSDASWIICRDVLRSAINGRVDCPAGQSASIEACLNCRLLEAIDGDRDEAYSCLTDAAARACATSSNGLLL